jgi:hypothetical protein
MSEEFASQEFACPNCRITLQVSSRQLGRQVRCPVCGLISVFGSATDESGAPRAGSGDWQPVAQTESNSFPPERGRPQRPGPDSWAPIEPTEPRIPRKPDSLDVRARAEEYVATYATSSSFEMAPDRAWWIGLICGLISLLGGNLICFCCLVGPFGSSVFAVVGLVSTACSRRGPKVVNFVIGGLGLIISLVMLLLIAISKMK